MARILIATVPIGGHVAPMAPIARALVGAGHEVAWYSGAKYRATIEASGARFVGRTKAVDFDDATFDHVPERVRFDGVEKLKFDMKHVFIDDAAGQVADVRAILAGYDADVLLVDAGFTGAAVLIETESRPVAVLGVLPMMLGSVDTAPFGLGLPPATSAVGRMRNRALRWSFEKVLFADVHRHWNAARASLGLGKGRFLTDAAGDAALFLQPTIPSFEYPRSDLAASVRFIGRLPVEAPSSWVRPEWWPELDAGRPVVHVSQGTIANEKPELFAPTLEGLASEDVLVVVSTGGRDPEALGLGKVPSNVRVHRYLSYPELFPKLSAFVTNGGYGGVQMAIAHGVPCVVAGTTEDKPEVAARVAWSGAGLDLKTATPSPSAVRSAVRRLLDEPAFRERTRALATEHARYDAVPRAVELIEGLTRESRISDAAE